MIFEIPGTPRFFLHTTLTQDRPFNGDPNAVLFEAVVAIDPQRTWSCQAFSKDLVAKRPSEHLVSSELWWSDTKRSLTNAAPENGRTTTVRILTGGRTEEDISSPPYPSIKLTWLLDPGIVLGELSLDHLARSDADAKWVKMMSDSLLSYRQLQAANESVISSAQKAYNLREEAIKAVEQMRKDKIDHEDEIYLKFKEVLNSKKRKIALLMQEVETLRGREHDEAEEESIEPVIPPPKKKAAAKARVPATTQGSQRTGSTQRSRTVKLDLEDEEEEQEPEVMTSRRKIQRHQTEAEDDDSETGDEGVAVKRHGAQNRRGTTVPAVSSQSRASSSRRLVVDSQEEDDIFSKAASHRSPALNADEEDDDEGDVSPGILD